MLHLNIINVTLLTNFFLSLKVLMMSNLSKFAKLAWTMTRSRQPPAPPPPPPPAPQSVPSTPNNNGILTGGGNAVIAKSDVSKTSFVDSLPEYKHIPPKSPPHILLHYSTFKVREWIIKSFSVCTHMCVMIGLCAICFLIPYCTVVLWFIKVTLK